MMRFISTLGMICLAGAAGYLGYRLTASHVATDIYRARLQEVSRDYENLRTQFNEAIRKTAVTELIVRDGQLTISVPQPDGQRRLLQTPFHPDREIYCDYVLIDGRLWIRRLYDDLTPPAQGMVLDGQFEFIDWNAPGASHGHAVYRSLAPGRWIVTVTGDGSMGLVPVGEDQFVTLTPAPQVHDYQEIQKQVDKAIEVIDAGDVIDHLMGR